MKFLIVRQILLVNTLVNVQRTVWRILILMLGCKGLTARKIVQSPKEIIFKGTLVEVNQFI